MRSHIIAGIIISAVFWIIACIAALTVLPHLRASAQREFPEVSSETWQAVFLENGQVYFGKLRDESGSYVSLSDVYYLREASDLQTGSLNLVKLGGEVHGPEDPIYVQKDKILFWENLKGSSRVVQSITGTKQ